MDRELRLDTVAVRLGHIEHDARRAASGVEGNLQVLDIIVESRGIERDSMLRVFDPGLIVPKRLVRVGLEAAEGRKSTKEKNTTTAEEHQHAPRVDGW